MPVPVLTCARPALHPGCSQSARGLLTGTTNVLMTFDSYEIRKIVTTGEAVIELLAAAKVGARALCFKSAFAFGPPSWFCSRAQWLQSYIIHTVSKQ